MSQMRLITDSRDEWTVKELVETLHAKVDDLERKLDAQLKRNEAISWQLHAIILHLTGDRAALTAFVMASEPTVVPNEDEAMPVLASCPCCERKEATTAEQVEELFGYRTMADGKTIVQSWCRECRGLEGKTSPRRKRAKAVAWSKMDAQACAFAKAYTQTRNEMLEYEAKAKNETYSPAVRAQYQAKADAKRKEQAKHKSEYNKRVAVLQAGLTK